MNPYDEEDARYDEQSEQESIHNGSEAEQEERERQRRVARGEGTLTERIRHFFGSDDGVL